MRLSKKFKKVSRKDRWEKKQRPQSAD